jgi:hypothetical protein
MPDIDRLIEAWEIFRDSNPYEICNGREFRAIKEPEYCMGQMIEDTITLLKEQEAEWVEYPECLAYDGAYSDSHIVCSACNHVFSTMDNCTEEFDYCPHCGAKMKQEGR